MSLLIIGSMAFDAIETPFGQTGKIVGGAASFISLASSLLNAKNGLVAVVGEDFEMDFIASSQGSSVQVFKCPPTTRSPISFSATSSRAATPPANTSKNVALDVF